MIFSTPHFNKHYTAYLWTLLMPFSWLVGLLSEHFFMLRAFYFYQDWQRDREKGEAGAGQLEEDHQGPPHQAEDPGQIHEEWSLRARTSCVISIQTEMLEKIRIEENSYMYVIICTQQLKNLLICKRNYQDFIYIINQNYYPCLPRIVFCLHCVLTLYVDANHGQSKIM